MKVKSIGSNKTEVQTNKFKLLVSYETPVAYIECLTLNAYKTDKFYSVTTSKHINQWLADNGYNAKDVKTLPDKFIQSLLEGLNE